MIFKCDVLCKYFTDCVRETELQALQMTRNRSRSDALVLLRVDALVQMLEFEAAKLASSYSNEFISSHCSQKISVLLCHYNGGRKEITKDKQFKRVKSLTMI